MMVGPDGAERGDGKRHGQPMIVPRIDFAALQAFAPADVEPVGELFNVATHAPEAVRQGRNPVALLDSQFSGTGDAQLAAVRGERPENGQLVDDAGHFAAGRSRSM